MMGLFEFNIEDAKYSWWKDGFRQGCAEVLQISYQDAKEKTKHLTSHEYFMNRMDIEEHLLLTMLKARISVEVIRGRTFLTRGCIGEVAKKYGIGTEFFNKPSDPFIESMEYEFSYKDFEDAVREDGKKYGRKWAESTK